MDKKGLGLRPYITSIVLTVLFTLSILLFSIGYIQETNPDNSLLNDSRLNNSITDLNTSINDLTSVSNSVYDQLGESEPTATDYLFLMFKGAFYIPIAFLGFLFNGITTIGSVLYITLGGGLLGGITTTIIGIITSILIIAVVFLIVKNIRSGESER